MSTALARLQHRARGRIRAHGAGSAAALLALALILGLFLALLIFALRSLRSLSRASLSSCAAKQNRHAFRCWVLAFKLFLGLNRATVLCVFVGSTVLLHTDAMAAISIFHPCRLRQTPCTMMTACSTA